MRQDKLLTIVKWGNKEAHISTDLDCPQCNATGLIIHTSPDDEKWVNTALCSCIVVNTKSEKSS